MNPKTIMSESDDRPSAEIRIILAGGRGERHVFAGLGDMVHWVRLVCPGVLVMVGSD
jgi:hypothetical protein